MSAVDSETWTCRGCGAQMIGRRTPDDLCTSCINLAMTTAPPAQPDLMTADYTDKAALYPQAAAPAHHYMVTTTGQLAGFLGGSTDSFTGQLLALMHKAAPGNRARLMVAFPREYATWESWILMHDPRCCDVARLVREIDRALSDGGPDTLADAQAAAETVVPAPQAYCITCDGDLHMFQGHAGWQHFRGQGTPESRIELFDAGHEPAVAWR